jgi:uridylate kinase
MAKRVAAKRVAAKRGLAGTGGPRLRQVVISLGGSLIAPDGVDVAFVKRFRDIIAKHATMPGHPTRFFLICGGGRIARDYMNASKAIVASDGKTRSSGITLDLVGIAATRLNAELVRGVFGSLATPTLLQLLDRKEHFPSSVRVVVCGGFLPGGSSDVDAVAIAKTYGVPTVLNLTNVDYVYDKDPRKHTDASPLPLLSWSDYLSLVSRTAGKTWVPGRHYPFDPVAAAAAKKAGLSVIVANGKNVDNLDRMLSCKPAKGTIISGR